ncbi:MAG TPA: hybrid sensor histidine kinase/response regulator [Polyangia bacterium]|nr:hybrid sensor histidine kinase/response regulator [Polyangia bacterium]
MYKVLHIEDDNVNRRLVRKVLCAAGFEVIEAVDGASGIRLALSTKPDVILLDIELPDMDGYAVTLGVRGELSGRDVPIVALSGKGDRQTTEAVGCDGYILKPIDIETFPGEVRSYLTGRAARRRVVAEDEPLLLAEGQRLAAELRRKVEELEHTNRRLMESEKLRADFYRNLSHELSTPLTPALGYLSMLLDEELGTLAPAQRRAVESIGRGVTRVRAVVENLLDMTALSTGRMTFFVRVYDFNQLAQKSVAFCLDRFKERGIDLENAIPEVPFRAHGDPDKLERAMVQLIENATKFCKSKGRVQVATRRVRDRLSFLVFDSGQGIPEQEIEAIFKTFYQIDGSPTREHGGAGLGLALARKIVERFGGEIWAESPPRTGGAPPWARTMVALSVPERMAEDRSEPRIAGPRDS